MAIKVWTGGSTVDNDWGTAANWEPSGVPVSADDVYIGFNSFTNRNADITGSLNQSAVTLDSLNISSNYTGNIGTDTAYLQIGATICRIGEAFDFTGIGSGSPRLKIDLGTAASTVTIVSSASTGTGDLPPILLLANNAATDISVSGDSTIGIAYADQSETATIDDIVTADSSTVLIGTGVTLGDVTINGGSQVKTRSNIVNLDMWGGEVDIEENATVTTATVKDGATLNYNSSGTMTTLNWYGTVNVLRTVSNTITNTNIYSGAGGVADFSTTTFTNAPQFRDCGVGDVDIDFGNNYSISFTGL